MKVLVYFVITLCLLLETSLVISWKTSSFLWKSEGVDVLRFRRGVSTVVGKVRKNTVLKPTSLLALPEERVDEENFTTKYYRILGYEMLSSLQKLVFDSLMGYEKLLQWILLVVLPFSIISLMLNTQLFHNWGYQSGDMKSLIDMMNQVLPYVFPIAFVGPLNGIVIKIYRELTAFLKIKETVQVNRSRNVKQRALLAAYYVYAIGFSVFCFRVMTRMIVRRSPDLQNLSDLHKWRVICVLLGMKSWDFFMIDNNHPLNVVLLLPLNVVLSLSMVNLPFII